MPTYLAVVDIIVMAVAVAVVLMVSFTCESTIHLAVYL